MDIWQQAVANNTIHRLIIAHISILLTNTQMNDYYNYDGKLIIIGGGDIPEEIFDLFSELVGGKDQNIVVIPTATEDELWIQASGHLQKFSTRGFTNLHTIHTRSKEDANSNHRFIDIIRSCKGLFFGGGIR